MNQTTLREFNTARIDRGNGDDDKSLVRRIFVNMLILLLAGGFASGAAAVGELFARPDNLDTAEQEILPVDEAFRFGSFKETDGYRVFWQVAPGYFLYRDKFVFQAGEAEFEVELEQGKWHLDEAFGKVEVLDGLVEAKLPNSKKSVSVHYQGCAAKGFCYPPQEKFITSEKKR